MAGKLKSFLFENQTTKQTVAKNTFWLFFGNIFSRLIRAAIIVYAARVLGAEGWGAFAYALSLAAFFTVFIDFGINAVMTRESIKNLESQEKYFSTALVMKLIMIMAIVLIIIFSSPYFVKQGEIMVLIPLVALIVGFDSLRDFGATLSRAWEKMEIEAFVQIFTNVLIVAAGFAALYYSPSPKSLAFGYAAGTGIGMIAAFFPFRKYLQNIRQNFSLSLIKPILAASWPIGMMSLMLTIMLNTDVIMIGWFKDIADVGYYSAAQRVMLLLAIIPTLIGTAVFPSIAKFIGEKEKVKMILEKSLASLILIAAPLTAGGVILARQIMSLLYGSEYLPGAASLMIMSFTFIPNFIATILANTIFALSQEKKLFSYVILGVFGNFLFNILLIPYFGIAGAALSTLFNQTILTIYLLAKVKKEISFAILPKIKKIAGATGIMLLALAIFLFLNINPYLVIAAGGMVYLFSLYLFKDETFLETIGIFTKRTA